MPTIPQSSVARPPAEQPPANQSSAYSGPALGRNDPVWEHYLKESSGRDSDLVEGWNKSMDVLLLFAALFSAVVTAFLVESHKSLKPDSAAITAASASRMVDLVEAMIASREPAPLNKALDTIEKFNPKRSDILINTLWFSSLALSMSVTLVAMLVKAWGDGYRRGDRFSPYYVQARTRQARYNGLKNWGAKQVVRILPIIMHIALGLFLLGLLLFLHTLSLVSMWPVMAIVLTTLGLYVVITLVPLFSAFCPYNTPLSSRTAWGFCYAIVNQILPSGEKWNTLPCEKEESVQSTSTALDRLTAQAVVWLVSHSQAENSKEVAIRSIANAIAGPEFWDHLIKDKLITLMAQHFISFFKGTLERPENNLADEILNSEDIQRQTYLCSQALAKIAKHTAIQPIQDAGTNSTIPECAVMESGHLMLPEAYFISVQSGLRSCIKLAASGYCGASAWYTSTGRTKQKQAPLLTKLLNFMSKNSSEICAGTSGIPDELLVDLVEALSVETSYSTWELQQQQINEAIKSVIKLCLGESSDKPTLLDGPARKAMSVELAVIAALINNYQKVPKTEIDQLSKGGRDKYGIRSQHIKAHEAYKLRHPYPPGSHLTYSRQWHAVWIAEVCAKNPKYLASHSDALLLLGLAGILRSFPMDPVLFADVTKLFAAQLTKARENHSGRMSLPFILVSSCDIQSQVAHDILATFHNQLSAPSSTVDHAKIGLMRCIVEHGQWFEFQPGFLIDLSRMLQLSHDKNFQYQCILALDNYWFMNCASGFDVYNLPHWEFFVDHDLIRILVDIFESISDELPKAIELGRSIISCFAKLARTVTIQTFPGPVSPSGTNVSEQSTQVGMAEPDPQGTAGQSNLHEMTNQAQNGHGVGAGSNQEANISNGRSNTSHSDILHQLLVALKKMPRDNKLFEVFSGDNAERQIDQDDFNFWKEKIRLLPNVPEKSTTGTTSQPPVASSSGSQTTATSNEPQAFQG